MLKGRHIGCLAAVLVLFCGLAAPAHAQQTLNFTLGGFKPFGLDARVNDDVLVANREFLALDINDFDNFTMGAEWLVPAGSFVEFGAGVAFFRSTVPTVYRDFVASDGTEIAQDLRLRMIPVALTARIVPTGLSSPVQPYIGGGLAIINYRYSEFGDFIDFGAPSRPVFSGSFVSKGTEVGPVVLGGIRFGSDEFTAGGEIRYQKADAELSNEFAAPRLDLGGWTYQFTVGVRFGR